MKKKMNTKDYIFAGAFAALYIVILLAAVMLFGFNPIIYLMTPLIAGIILGPVFILYISKVPKKGAILILAILTGLVMSSYSIIPLVIAIAVGILAELVLTNRKGNIKVKNVIAYSIFNICLVGPFTMLLFARDQFMQTSADYYGQDYVDRISALTPDWILLVLVGLAIIGGLIGATLGNKLNKKHFEQAGIV
ncbi:MptD family putative ECF transporter S component [Pseudogracilibacillus sp. SO30301A]|uniref:MptD family putative ECF transporter S component n=1 Tax=Pseudogracilibacillus sp. SO30301A TaxID=3098291 RepID=UPI00300E3BD1